MRPGSFFRQTGISLLEVLISVAIAGALIAALSGVVGGAIDAERGTRVQHDTLQQARFALERMVTAVGKTRQLLIPLSENPATAWKESERTVLAVTLDPTLDRDKDGWADANNDKDFLDVNNNGSRDIGEPERIDEDLDKDSTNDGNPGIFGIDDDNDGNVDEGSKHDNDEDSTESEESLNGIDDDGDGSIDEDLDNDMTGDGQPGIKDIDDDFDGLIDEGGKKEDDDEDGLQNEDWLDPVVFFLNGTTLMERIPNINPSSGTDYTQYPIADNVSQFLVKRIQGGNGVTVLVNISLTLSPPGAVPVKLDTTIGVGSGL